MESRIMGISKMGPLPTHKIDISFSLHQKKFIKIKGSRERNAVFLYTDFYFFYFFDRKQQRDILIEKRSTREG